MSNEDRLSLLIKVKDQGLAQIIRSLMEANDIECFVFDDHAAGVGAAFYDIRVMVPESYLTKAQNILENTEELKDEV